MKKISDHTLHLFTTYTSQEITIDEFHELKQWIDQSEENKESFSNYLLLYKRARRIAFSENLDQNKAWTSIVSQLQQPLIQVAQKQLENKPRPIFRKLWFRYAAASIVLLISITYFLNKSEGLQFTDSIIVNNNIQTGTNKAILTLESGDEVTLENGASFQTQNATSNGKEIVYEEGKQNKSKIAYNTLTIPRGGQFFINLSDGTKVWLNSESQLKYPVAFNDGETRQVELVYGEAYFKVSPSTQHKGSKFKVLNQSQEIEVLGTEFNIKAYKNDSNIYTTLVEGKVSVSTGGLNQLLKPAQQANLNLHDNTIAVATVNIYNEISWKEGVFSFRRKPLSEIMKVLSRWYDMDVNFANPEIKKAGFNGVLGKDQNIEEILQTIKDFGIIKDYEISNKTVFLK